MGDENKVRDAADAVRGIVEAVPIYDDALQPAVREIGKGLQGAVRMALAPLSGMVWGYDRITSYLSECLAKKLENAPPEGIVTPAANVAVPILESLRYSGETPELREMFANLLSTAMKSTSARLAHPAFVDVIRNLSVDEAKVLSVLRGDETYPLVEIRSAFPAIIDQPLTTTRFHIELRRFSTLPEAAGCECPYPSALIIDNLIRLGLVDVPEGELTDVEAYQPLLGHEIIKELTALIRQAERSVGFNRGFFLVTEFGRNFLAACVEPRDHTEASRE